LDSGVKGRKLGAILHLFSFRGATPDFRGVLGEPLTKHIGVKIRLRILAADLSTLSFAVAYLSNYRLRWFGNDGSRFLTEEVMHLVGTPLR
jgi:hypothetical protein